ncbi:MAG: heme-binding protein, partial [Planctomycetes bacterium]|nr:heme-binding protein [Planctomycetota bacterium]
MMSVNGLDGSRVGRSTSAWRAATWCLVAGALVITGIHGATTACAAEPDWIWSPKHQPNKVPRQAACYFRKGFTTKAPDRVQVTIAADDEYELYLNGETVGTGRSNGEPDQFDVSRHVREGKNTVAVKVVNVDGSGAALAMSILIKERNASWVVVSTDNTWRTNLRPLPLWNTTFYNDQFWTPARVSTEPRDTAGPADGTGAEQPEASRRKPDSARRQPLEAEQGDPPQSPAESATAATHGLSDADEAVAAERFRAPKQFEVEQLIDAEAAGSLIAMAFNEFGQVIASREGGPLLLIADTNDDGIVDDVRVVCDRVKNVQGILPLNGEVFVTADGPEGNGLYRLSDEDLDESLESARLLVQFTGEIGAHGIALGPDGWIYIVVGNHSRPTKKYSAASPHRDYYEGDLVGPRYEDPTLRGKGMEAPGGVVLRTNSEGEELQLVAGGLRNAYDLAFTADGELFVHDSAMETDLGTPWYRPTRLCHVTPGAEFGWRSGWAKWPTYYVDSLPSAADTGRGSPMGAVVYNHVMFPADLQNAMFVADWSGGRILTVKMNRQGASYAADPKVFLVGRPLNVTDLDVGPDGWLYFVTGGRGTEGGLYRVVFRGSPAENSRTSGTGIAAAIRQPQWHSAWGRQAIAQQREELGEAWGRALLHVARSTTNPPEHRVRALELMQLYGPNPTTSLLLTLSTDSNEAVRAKVADIMGTRSDKTLHDRLVAMLGDPDAIVRRKVCESLARAGQVAPPEKLAPCLASQDRFEACAARRLLERCPVATWRGPLLGSKNNRVFVQAALALLTAHPSDEHAAA